MEHAQATKLAIAMPTTGGINKARTTVSLFGLAAELGARGLSPRLLQIDGWDVVCARDLLAANFLKSDATHLLFCDSDMEFSADAALRLLETRQPFVAGAYAHRFLDLERMRSLVAEGKNFDTAFALAHKFNILSPRQAPGLNGLLEVDGVGAGFMLIARQVFERIADRLKPRRYQRQGEVLRAFFEPMTIDGTALSEDLAFCQRWREIGGRIFVCPDVDVRHVGEMSFGFPFARLMPAPRAAAAE